MLPWRSLDVLLITSTTLKPGKSVSQLLTYSHRECPMRGARHSRNLVRRRQKSNLKSRNPSWNPEIQLKSRNPIKIWSEIRFEIQKSSTKSRNPPEISYAYPAEWRTPRSHELTTANVTPSMQVSKHWVQISKQQPGVTKNFWLPRRKTGERSEPENWNIIKINEGIKKNDVSQNEVSRFQPTPHTPLATQISAKQTPMLLLHLNSRFVN